MFKMFFDRISANAFAAILCVFAMFGYDVTVVDIRTIGDSDYINAFIRFERMSRLYGYKSSKDLATVRTIVRKVHAIVKADLQARAYDSSTVTTVIGNDWFTTNYSVDYSMIKTFDSHRYIRLR